MGARVGAVVVGEAELGLADGAWDSLQPCARIGRRTEERAARNHPPQPACAAKRSEGVGESAHPLRVCEEAFAFAPADFRAEWSRSCCAGHRRRLGPRRRQRMGDAAVLDHEREGEEGGNRCSFPAVVC